MGVKKIILLSVMLLFMFGSVASAEITRGHDEFSGGKRISSFDNTLKSVDSLDFQKIIGAKSSAYYVIATLKTLREFSFSKENTEISIDGSPAQQLDVKETFFMPTSSGGIGPSLVTVNIKQDIINEIKSAKRLALRFQRNGTVPVIVVLPNSDLEEWQQVINMEK